MVHNSSSGKIQTSSLPRKMTIPDGFLLNEQTKSIDVSTSKLLYITETSFKNFKTPTAHYARHIPLHLLGGCVNEMLASVNLPLGSHGLFGIRI